MRRWSLALLVTLASPALAQAPTPGAEPAQAPPAAPAPEPKAETQAPEAKAPEAKPQPATPAEARPAPAEAKPAPAETKAAPAEARPAPTEPQMAPAEAKPTPAETKAAPPAPAPATRPSPPAPAEAKAAPVPPVVAPAAKPPTPAPAAPVPAPSAQAAAPASVPAPTAEAAAPTDPETARRQRILSEARFIFENLLTGDVRGAAGELLYPFQLEDKRYGTPQELIAAWVKQLRMKRTDLVTLYDIEVLSMPEMEKKYGKPPARLGLGALKEADVYVAVGNLSGHAAILLFRAPQTATPKAFAYTD